MTQENELNNSTDISLKEQLDQYLRYWPWFAIAIIIAVFSAFIYLRYTTRVYETQATILIKDTNNNQLSELAAFEDMGLAGAGLSKSEFENEVEVLKSKKLAAQVVEELDLNISYYYLGDVRNVEIYDSRPFTLKLLDGQQNIDKGIVFKVTDITATGFTLIDVATENILKDQKFGSRIEFNKIHFTIIPDVGVLNNYFSENETGFVVSISEFDNAVRSLQSSIQVSSVGQLSSIVRLSTTTAEKGKAQDILNTLINKYNEDASADKNQVSRNTAKFIEKRLSLITQELDSVESKMVGFKESRRLTDVEAEGQLFLENASDFNKRSLEVATQREIVNTYEELLSSGNTTSLLPANLGLDGEAASGINSYNELVQERNRLLISATEENPVAMQLKTQIDDLRANILASLNSLSGSIAIQERDLKNQESQLQGKIGEIPTVEKELRDIVRQREIKEQLYLYLLQKREETAISLAVTTPKAKIVDAAYSSRFPVSPKPKIIYLGGLVLGLLIPFVIIYTKNLLDTKIHNRVDVEEIMSGLPILGEIPQIEKGDTDIIKANDRSVLAEAFRIVRTNLSYLLSSGANSKKIIYVTSTIKGEGKTFVASNLALTLTSSGKSVLLIGADIRNPQIHRYVNKPDSKGLSEYLFDEKVNVKSIINEVEIHRQRFDVILSGRIPPNPAELLLSDRFKQLIDDVKDKYDYIMVDTAPTMLVTDTLLISQYADVTVYISRAEYTEKKLLNYPKELIKEEKLKNVAFIVNDVAQANFGYGTKYGYGYGVDEKKWYENIYSALRIRKKFRS